MGDLQCFSVDRFGSGLLVNPWHLIVILCMYIYIYIQSIYHIYIYSDDNMIIMVPGIDKQTYHCIHILCLSYIHIFIAYIYIIVICGMMYTIGIPR